MANFPDVSDVHVNVPLTDVSVMYRNMEYFSDQLFPMKGVDHQADIIPEYLQSYWFRNYVDQVGFDGVVPEAGWRVDTTRTYACLKYGLKHAIPDEVRANQDAIWDQDRDTTFWLTDQMLQFRDILWTTKFFTTTVWGRDVTGGTDFTVFSDYGASNPVPVIRNEKLLIRRKIGRNPNNLLFGEDVLYQLIDHPLILDRIKYTERAIATPDLLAALLDIPNIFIARTIKTTGAEAVVPTITSESALTYSDIVTNGLFLYFAPPAAAVMTPSAGYTFFWKTMRGGPHWIRSYRWEPTLRVFHEALGYFDQKQISKNAGTFFATAI